MTAPLALFTVAAMQGLAKLAQYRNDARGRLQYPDGLTFGQEDISSDEIEAERNAMTRVGQLAESVDNDEDEEASISTSIIDSCLRIIVGNRDMDDCGTSMSPSGNADHSVTPSLFQKMITFHRHRQDPIRVVVIGDSLAIGVGCIEQFEAMEDRPMSLIENTKVENSSNKTSPVFPQALARTLSLHFKRPVHWRSGGVDGGDIRDIREFCMDIVKQESKRDSATIDIVLVIFGLNDLKKLPTNLDGGVSQFRQGMEQLISDIRSHAPGALVVIPQIPIRMDVFLLGVFWDGTLAFWEHIKRLVANRKNNNSIYLELKKEELLDLYHCRRSSLRMSTNDLIHHLVEVEDHGSGVGGGDEGAPVVEHEIFSPDNAHPNKRTYEKWAELVGNQLHARITAKVEQMRRGKCHTLDSKSVSK